MRHVLLETCDGRVSIVKDFKLDRACSIAIVTPNGIKVEFISEELHDLLLKEIGGVQK